MQSGGQRAKSTGNRWDRQHWLWDGKVGWGGGSRSVLKRFGKSLGEATTTIKCQRWDSFWKNGPQDLLGRDFLEIGNGFPIQMVSQIMVGILGQSTKVHLDHNGAFWWSVLSPAYLKPELWVPRPLRESPEWERREPDLGTKKCQAPLLIPVAGLLGVL